MDVDEKSVQTDAIVNKAEEINSVKAEKMESAKTFGHNVCHQKLNSISALKKHKREFHGSGEKNLLESQLQNIKFQSSSEAMKLSHRLALIKEKEMKKNNACNFRTFCRIVISCFSSSYALNDELSQRMQDLLSLS